MTHPFFDVSSYPWHRPEAIQLHSLLTTNISVVARIDMLYRESAINPLPLAINHPPDVIWKEVLENLAGVHGALRKLCNLILANPMFGAIHNVIRLIEKAQPAVDAQIISDDILVLDRVRLREKLKLLDSDAGPIKVLLVRGGPLSGKSHGRYLFERAAWDQCALPVYLCDGLVATVDEVVMHLFSALEALQQIPPRLTTEDAWYKLVCIKLQEIALSKQRRLWIAIDDLGPARDGGPLLDTEIRKFCEQFALNMLNPVFRQCFRLMLIHYPDGPVPTKWKQDFWTEDRTSDTDVLQQDVENILRSWSVAHDRKMIEDELIKLAGEVVAKAEAPVAQGQKDIPRLKRIHDTLTETLKDLARR